MSKICYKCKSANVDEAKFYPDGNSSNKSKCGLLYNWKAVMRNSLSSGRNPSGVQGICLVGRVWSTNQNVLVNSMLRQL